MSSIIYKQPVTEEQQKAVVQAAENKANFDEIKQELKNKTNQLANDDIEIVGLLSRCRKSVEDGDIQEAYDIIQMAKKRYPDNLRIEAFAWNYLR